MKHSSQRGSATVPPILLLALLALGLAWGAKSLRGSVVHARFDTIDTLRVGLVVHPREGRLAHWVDPRWEDDLRLRIAEFADIAVSDRESILDLCRAVETYPYIAEVGDSAVQWPDGLQLDVRFRRPVACIQRDGEFYCLDAEGMLLPGAWPLPPESEAGYLPRIVESDVTEETSRARPGSFITDLAVLDALSVVRSMEEHLTEADRHRVGRVRIDARLGRQASPKMAGVVIDLERRRRIWFGRAPAEKAPGEVRPERKWNNFSLALAELEKGLDWSLIDLRWDTAPIWERRAAHRSAAETEREAIEAEQSFIEREAFNGSNDSGSSVDPIVE